MNESRILRLLAGTVVLVAFMAAMAIFTAWPAYRYLQPDEAVVKLSLRHAGVRLGECRTRSEAEMAELPPNMRAAQECPRERSPLHLQLEFDGRRLIDTTLAPRGLHGDGRAAFYQRLKVPAGSFRVAVKMTDGHPQRRFSISARA
ncbi:MAG: hypothetical protein U5Q16_15835 [Gammaproteobacteria bacterium]|nr:hypothetical protein [Gammaproteobacteria bacterium]